MLLEEMNAMSNSWIFLQQPVHPGQGMNASFRSLLAAIDQGWEVEEPLKLIPSLQSGLLTYQFTLTNHHLHQAYQLLVPATPETERFIHHNGYQVEKTGHRPN